MADSSGPSSYRSYNDPLARKINPAKSRKGKLFLENRQPKLLENDKSALYLRGSKSNQTIFQFLNDVFMLKKGQAADRKLERNNPVYPFDDETFLEKFCQKYDASMFLFGNHTKKRPNNVIFGRMFDFHILDMFEFGLTNFTSLQSIKGQKCSSGVKPVLLISGELFETDPVYIRMKNFFIDFFQGPRIDGVHLQGIEHTVAITATRDAILFRSYRILLKRSDSKTPYAVLAEMGPNFDLVLRRHRLASDDLFKQACKQPKELKVRKKKNITMDPLGTKLARIHLGKQEIGKLQTRKVRALKTGEKGPPRKRRKAE